MRKVNLEDAVKQVICPFCGQRYKDESKVDYYLVGSQKVYYCENYECGEEFTENLVVKKSKTYKKLKKEIE